MFDLTSIGFEQSNPLVKGLSPLTPRRKGDDSNGHISLCSSNNLGIFIKHCCCNIS